MIEREHEKEVDVGLSTGARAGEGVCGQVTRIPRAKNGTLK